MVMSRTGVLAVLTPLGLVALALGCRSILGIEQKQFDSALADAGAEAGPAELSCANYCDTIMSQCTGSNAQYPNMATCLGLCSVFPVGSLTDTNVDTLGCRINQVINNLTELSTGCSSAGPGGNNICGASLCEALCDSALVVCPDDFSSHLDCMTECMPLGTCPLSYAVVGQALPDDSSVECRIYHLSAAAADLPSDAGGDTPAQVTHCPHVMGVGYCDVDAGACTGTD
jgi:hypothetical protein